MSENKLIVDGPRPRPANRSLAEIPLTSSTVLDPSLGLGRSRARLQKCRQVLRKELVPGRKLSLGRHGTLQLDSVAFLPCLQTASRWSGPWMNNLITAFRQAGMGELAHSEDYSRTVELTMSAVRDRLADNPSPSGREKSTDGAPGKDARGLVELLARVTSELMEKEPTVFRVATELGEIGARVEGAVSGFHRLPGRVVRFDAPEALVAIEEDGEERLQKVDTSYLRSMGIEHEGDPFVLQELRWTPDTTARLFIPAVELSEPVDYEGLSKRVEAARTPLPRPAR